MPADVISSTAVDEAEARGAGLPGWAEYLRWNDAIAQHFFLSGRSQGRPVYLSMDAECEPELASCLGVDPSEIDGSLAKAVARTLNLRRSVSRVFAEHAEALRRWRRGRQPCPPPMVGLLGLLARIAGAMASDEAFEANCYYGRLAEALGVVDAEARERLQEDFRHDTLVLWSALNTWLEDNDGRYGLPTAYALDSRRFVSIPLSQALIRAQDRRKLVTFFEYSDLSPGQRVAPADMSLLLGDWLSRDHTCAQLRALWRRSNLRQRIAEIACRELEGWEGSSPDDRADGVAEGRMAVAAWLWEEPLPEIRFELRARTGLAGKHREFELTPDAARSLRPLLGPAALSIKLVQASDPGWLSLTGLRTSSFSSTLLSDVSIRPRNGDDPVLSRRPRAVVPLRFEPLEAAFVEVERAQLGETFLVLAHRSKAAAVSAHLGQSALRGFRERRDLAGLPKDWVAFTDVVVVAQAPTGDVALRALCPLATIQITARGGFSLGRSTWLRASPPEIVAVAPAADDLGVALESPEGGTQELGSLVPLGDGQAAGSWSIGGIARSDGDYRAILAKSGAGQAGTLALRLRSGSSPRAQGAGSVSLEHDLSVKSGALTAVDAGVRETGAPYIRGARVPATLPMTELPAGAPLQPAAVIPEGAALDDEVSREPSCEPAPEALQPCAVTGYHIWVMPPGGLGRNPAREGKCKTCGEWRQFRRLRRLGNGTTGVAIEVAGQAERSDSAHRDLPALTPSSGPSWDDLLDAATYLGGGAWAEYERMARQISSDPWSAAASAARLVALAHVDVTVRRGRVERWAVAPATVVLAAGGTGFLCGARSQALVRSLEASCKRRGGSVQVVPQPASPAQVTILGLDEASLTAIAASCSAEIAGGLAVIAQPAGRLATALPSLLEAVQASDAIPVPHGPYERFNPSTAQWLPVEAVQEPGGYRVTGNGRLCFSVTEADLAQGECRISTVYAVKHMAAVIAGARLMRYDPQAKIVEVPLGAELPGLYGRAAVLCSGRVPQRVGGRSQYVDVSADVAEALLARLGDTRKLGA